MMQATKARDVMHFCRKCGQSFRSSRAASAHTLARVHADQAHGFRVVERCPAGCGLKASYFETQMGKMLYGAGAGPEREGF